MRSELVNVSTNSGRMNDALVVWVRNPPLETGIPHGNPLFSDNQRHLSMVHLKDDADLLDASVSKMTG